MKHSAPPAKPEALVVILVMAGLAIFITACSVGTRTSPPAQFQLAASNPTRLNAININTAPAQELETLPGVGKAIAERIIAHRERYGRFRRVEHLLMVRGISDRRFRALLPLITVDGGAGAGPPS